MGHWALGIGHGGSDRSPNKIGNGCRKSYFRVDFGLTSNNVSGEIMNPQKKPLQPVPPPPKQSNAAVDELVALRLEMSEFRKEFAKFNKELSLKVAFGIIGSLILMRVIGEFLGLFGS